MIVKLLDFEPYNKEGEPVVVPVSNKGLIKEASSSLAPEILEYLDRHKADDGFVRTVISALGSYEAWGANNNADAFFESDLLKVQPKYGNVPMFKTYEIYGKPFKHHRNTDKDKAYGRVVYAVYNPIMKRVEIVVDFSRADAPDICSDIDRGILPKTSMGFKCEVDECLVCGNQARKRSEYCDHIKRHALEIYPDGSIAAVRNLAGYFFDISVVSVPAWKPSVVLIKAAGAKNVKLSADRAVEEGLDDKNADIKKEIPAKIEAVQVPDKIKEFATVGAARLRDFEQRLPQDIIDELAAMPLERAISTLVMLGIKLHPDEFQEMVLKNAGKEKLAEELKEAGIVFREEYDKITPFVPRGRFVDVDFATKFASEHSDILRNRSLHRQWLVKRAIDVEEAMRAWPKVNVPLPYEKKQPVEERVIYVNNQIPMQPQKTFYEKAESNPLTALAGLAALYGGIRWLGDRTGSEFTSVLKKNPYLFASLLGASLAATLFGQSAVKKHFQKKDLEKQAGITGKDIANALEQSFFARSLITIPAAYTAAQVAREQRKRGQEPNALWDFVNRHPLITALGGAYLLKFPIKDLRAMFQKTGSDIREAVENDMIGYYPPELIDNFIINKVT